MQMITTAGSAETIILNLLRSSDSAWYQRNEGHDWREAVDAAEKYLKGLRLSPARGSALRGLGWSYSQYLASLYLDGERFAIVTPDGRNALSRKDAKLILEALNRKSPSDKLTHGSRASDVDSTQNCERG